MTTTCIAHVSLADSHGFWNKEDLIIRKLLAEHVRVESAMAAAMRNEVQEQKTNNDLKKYNDHRGSFSKALVHDAYGIVSDQSFKSLIGALKSGSPKKFDQIILGGQRHLVNPQATYAYTLEGADAAACTITKAPAFASAQAAGEMVELYWGALLRDVPFNEYAINPIATQAIADLNTMSDFRGPKINGLVTPQTLWKGVTPGELVGPYVSQFLYKPVPDHGLPVSQNYYQYKAGIDYLTDTNELLLIQNGGSTGQTNQYETNPIFIRNGRDLGTYVHNDYPGEAFFNAALILLGYGSPALDDNNPYKDNPTQDGFVTYGGPNVLELVNCACEAGLKAAWYQKWMCHLRLRPEYFGLLTQEEIVNSFDYNIQSDLINSPALSKVFDVYGTYVLPQMYPEGSPTHPSYPAGHAVIAGACATILKAFFNEDFAIPSPVQPNSTNTALESHGGPLYVGHELNKLASNICMGRNWAGVHYRSDGIEGMLLGEKIAISILQDEAYTGNENFKGYTLTKFNGETIVVGKSIHIQS